MAESIDLIGLLTPIICDHDNTLLAGAHRLKAHKYLGKEQIGVNYKGVD
ncbi:MAG: ParB N-terminal domain-containing protein [Desulfarculaceae bacterium]|nr:ParB N-terminal domain-containing protein [Desulfarculaceae bacterium]